MRAGGAAARRAARRRSTPRCASTLRDEIRRIQTEVGITTLFVTHDQEEALAISDRVGVMSQGQLEQLGTPTEVYRTPSTAFVARFVGSMNELPATVLGNDAVEVLGQTIPIRSTNGHPTGAEVCLLVRPEDLQIVDGDDGLAGTVDRGDVPGRGRRSSACASTCSTPLIGAHLASARVNGLEPGARVTVTRGAAANASSASRPTRSRPATSRSNSGSHQRSAARATGSGAGSSHGWHGARRSAGEPARSLGPEWLSFSFVDRGRRTATAGGRRGAAAAVAGVVGVLVLGACASGGADANADTVGDCPGGRIPIVVTVDQWGDLVGRLAGACGDVTTIVSGTTGDPHDYEPTPADLAAFGDAELVVVNGLGYDAWADKALDALGHRPAVVDAGEVAGRDDGDNPHLWYDQATVRAAADAVTEELTALRPRAVEQLPRRPAPPSSRTWRPTTPRSRRSRPRTGSHRTRRPSRCST